MRRRYRLAQPRLRRDWDAFQEGGAMLKKEEEIICMLIAVLDVLWQGRFAPSEQTMAYVRKHLKECGYTVPEGWPR